jgi:hypothetical protein
MEKIYGIRITETSSRILAVKANSLDEAFELIEDAYRNSEIVLDADYFDEYEISALPYSAEDGSITEKDAQYYEHFNF